MGPIENPVYTFMGPLESPVYTFMGPFEISLNIFKEPPWKPRIHEVIWYLLMGLKGGAVSDPLITGGSIGRPILGVI